MFHEKVVIVTGGSGGIGSAIIRGFAKKRAKVYFTYKNNEEHAKALEDELNEFGNVKSYKMDVIDGNEVKEVFQSIYKENGKIDILVNNAGVTNDGFLMLMSEENWDKVIDTNLKGVFTCSKAALPCMISKKKGVIINISSVAGLMGVSAQTNYCASKFGVIGMTRALAKEVANKNIRVNAVAPGYIDTDMVKKVPSHIRDKFVDSIPCKRMGTPENIADVVMFLASEQSSYIMGQTIVVDGGLLS